MGLNQHFILLYGVRLDKTEFLSNFDNPYAWWDELEPYIDGYEGETLCIQDQAEHDLPWCYIGYKLAEMSEYDDYDALSLEIETPDKQSIISEIKAKLGIDVQDVNLWLFNQWY